MQMNVFTKQKQTHRRRKHTYGYQKGKDTEGKIKSLGLTDMLLLLLLSRFSRVRFYATPQTAAHQAPLSLGFSSQEHWSGCHFFLQCMKVKSESEVTSVVSDSVRHHRQQPTRLLRPWDFPGKNTGVGCHCILQTDTLPYIKQISNKDPLYSIGNYTRYLLIT